jgi:hypothetical protein
VPSGLAQVEKWRLAQVAAAREVASGGWRSWRLAAGEVAYWRLASWARGEGNRRAATVGEVAAGGLGLRVRFSANCAAGCGCA